MDEFLLPPPEKRRRIPPRVREAVALICEGRARTIAAAAKKVGLSREYLSRALGEPHIAEHLRQKAARAVAISSGHAAARITELINKSRSDHVAFEASKFSLGVAGIRPQPEAQLNVNVDIKAGFVIDLSEPGESRPMKVVSPVEAPLKSWPPSNSEIAE
jgi:ParB-like chromosome segregation protein Spo0J